MNASNSSSAAEFFICSIQLVYIIINISILGVMLFFKMYHKLIYRLLFYALFAATISEIIGIASVLMTIKVQDHHVEFVSIDNNTVSIVFRYLQYASLISFFLLLNSMGFCLFLLAIYHHQFPSWVADLVILLVCLTLSQPSPIIFLIFLHWPHQYPVNIFLVAEITLIFLVNIGLTTLTMVPMCCRACGYNMCMRSLATRESHQQALREILPLFILTLPSSLATLCYLILTVSEHLILWEKWGLNVLVLTIGLVLPLSFAVHLCILGKTKLKKLRGKTRLPPPPTAYRTNVNQLHVHTYRTTVFTSEGISETCNTDYPHVSEDEVDNLLLHNNIQYRTTV